MFFFIADMTISFALSTTGNIGAKIGAPRDGDLTVIAEISIVCRN
jgi:hypothetical protein